MTYFTSLIIGVFMMVFGDYIGFDRRQRNRRPAWHTTMISNLGLLLTIAAVARMIYAIIYTGGVSWI